MNPINPIFQPELSKLISDAQNLANSMALRGHATWELGPLCTRDHAQQLHQLKDAIKEHFKIDDSEPRCEYLHHPPALRHSHDQPCPVAKRWRASFQRIHSILENTP